MDYSKNIILISMAVILFSFQPADARRAKSSDNGDASSEVINGLFIDTRALFSEYDFCGFNIWTAYSRTERIKIFDILMFFVLKDLLDFPNIDLMGKLALKKGVPEVVSIIETKNATGLKTIVRTEVGIREIDRWLQRDRFLSLFLLDKMANGVFFTVDDVAMYIDEYMSFYRRFFVEPSDYSGDVLMLMMDWVTEPAAFLKIIEHHLSIMRSSL